MGEATDRKVTEIEETRRQLEADLRELEERHPGTVAIHEEPGGHHRGEHGADRAPPSEGCRSKRSDDRPSAEVVIRIVRDDV